MYLQKEEYRNNGTLAVLMYKEDGDLYGCITVNLNHPLQSDTLAFLDENNMPGIGKWLRKKKLGIDMGVSATWYPSYSNGSYDESPSGFISCQISFVFL